MKRDSQFLLHCLVAKAARERVVNEASARPVWEQIAKVAEAIGDGRWQRRAQAEIGEISYMEGDVKEAVRLFLVKDAGFPFLAYQGKSFPKEFSVRH